jgi:NADH-quinone oxidoreductase subunit L
MRYIIFAPLAGALINWLIGRRVRNEKFIGAVACGSVGISTILAFYFAFKHDGALHATGPLLDHIWTWISVGSFRADFGLAMDRLSGIYTLFITFVGFLIHLFATGYMHGDKSFYRFFAYLNLFMFSMLTLVLADNFLLMFVGWEGVGLCSYLLIGYYVDRKEVGDAAKKAFIANRVGDWGVVMGIMLIFFLTSQAGNASISFFDKPGVTSALTTLAGMGADPFAWKALFAGGITSVAILLFIGATGKSAQIPLYVWLPDAMAGPTPVSALIHAATMVTAGVYMVVRCNAIFQLAPTASFIIAIIGALTAIFAATIGLAQNDIKKVLAYSTVSQLGYMFLACGVGAYIAAIFHVMTHAFFKALLFLGSGSVIHGMHHEQDMRRMGGLKKYMPITFATMMAGWLAICGIPIWAGFFSKDEILWMTWSTSSIPHPWNYVLWGVGAVTALLTAIYMTRMMVMTFWGDERFREAHAETSHHSDDSHSHDTASAHADDHAHHGPVEPHESPWTMTVPLVVLAILSTLGGLVGVPYALSGGKIPNFFEHTLEPVIAKISTTHVTKTAEPSHEAPTMLSPAPQTTDGPPALAPVEGTSPDAAGAESHSPEEVRMERIFTAISVAIALLGIGIGWVIFKKRPLLQLPRLLEQKYYVDEIYDGAVINPINAVSREGLWKIFDIRVIDGIVNGLGRSVARIGSLTRYMQVGFTRTYAAIIVLGAILLIAYFAYSFRDVLNP